MLQLPGLACRCGAGNVEIADYADGVEAVLEGCKGGRLWEEHEEAVETFVQVWISFWLKELEAKI